MAQRWVLHVDMDQFLVAVELLRHPELVGLPVIVGGRGDPTERAVVSTASYEARARGVHSGLALKLAVRRCPEAVLLPVDFPVVRGGVRRGDGDPAGVAGRGGRGARLGRGVRRRRDRRPAATALEIQAAVLARDRPALLDRHRRHPGAGQDRDRLRQAAGHLLPAPRQLARRDGAPADDRAVGSRHEDRPAARGGRARHRRPARGESGRAARRGVRARTPVRTSAASVAAAGARGPTTHRGSRGRTVARRPTRSTSPPGPRSPRPCASWPSG